MADGIDGSSEQNTLPSSEETVARTVMPRAGATPAVQRTGKRQTNAKTVESGVWQDAQIFLVKMVVSG